MRVGQQVAWPTVRSGSIEFPSTAGLIRAASTKQLHMIENRLKVERSVLKGRAEVRHALHKAARQQKTAKDTADRSSPPRSTSPPDGLSEPTSQGKTPFIPLESDAEVGFATRSKFRRRTALGQAMQPHTSASNDSTPAGRSRETTEPISYADATRYASNAAEFGTSTSAPATVRRRRVKTASPDMEFGSRGHRRSASWSRARQRELKELLNSRMGENYASSVEEEEETVTGKQGMRSAEVSPRQRSSTFPAVLSKLPAFTLGRGKDAHREDKTDNDHNDNLADLAEEPSADPSTSTQQEEDALGLNLRSGLLSRSSSGPGRSRLSRWLSPDPTTSPGLDRAPTGFSHSGTPAEGGTEDEDQDEDDEEELGDGYSLPSESSTDEEGDEAIYIGEVAG